MLSGELYVTLHETRGADKSSAVRSRHPFLCKDSFKEPAVFSMLLATTKTNNSLCVGDKVQIPKRGVLGSCDGHMVAFQSRRYGQFPVSRKIKKNTRVMISKAISCG